jgi:uncharacterized protein
LSLLNLPLRGVRLRTSAIFSWSWILASGLFALLDDVAAIAKVAASSLDDVAAQSMKAGSKAAGIVIDDTAVTPRYVVGFASHRELPIIWKIALGSLKNKLLLLLPGALFLSWLMPWAITPLLMFGGLFLCFEGYEKLHSMVMPHADDHDEELADAAAQTSHEFENEKVAGAIRTDFILSAEIMALTLAGVAHLPLLMRSTVLGAVGILITAAVYGVVALIVKADDLGAAMARTGTPGVAHMGRALVKGMPIFLSILSVIGTLAMLWVGGDIILHGLANYGIDGPEHWIKDTAKSIAGALPILSGFFTWMLGALGSGVVGTVLGALTVPVVNYVISPIMQAVRKPKTA